MNDHDGIVRRLVIEAGPKAPMPTIELTITPLPPTVDGQTGRTER